MSLQQFFRILNARRVSMLVTLALVVGATVAISWQLPKRYTASSAVVVDFRGVDAISGVLVPMLPVAGAVATQVDIIQSRGVARRAVDALRLADNPSAKQLYMEATGGRGSVRDWFAEILMKNLKVEPSRESSVIHVGYSGNDPKFAAAVVNAVVQSYIATNLELKTAPARQTNAFFGEQIRALREKVERAQASLSQYQRSKGIVATDERLDVETNRLNELSSQLVAAQSQTYDAEQRQRQVQDAIARGEVPESVAEVVNNPVIQQLKTQLAALAAKLDDVSSKLGRNHPQYVSTTAEIGAVRGKLGQEMSTLGRTVAGNATIAKQREDQIKAALDVQRGKVLETKRVRESLAVMMRDAESAQRAYDGAMARMAQTGLESQTTHTNAMVINEAIEPIEPSSPKILLNAIFSIVLGSMVAVAVALLREMSERIVRSELDLTDTLDLPVLGVLGRDGRQLRRCAHGFALPAARNG